MLQYLYANFIKIHVFSLQANKENLSTPPRDAPPPTPITKGLNLTTTPIVKKEKRQTSSRYNVSKNCELTTLPILNESKYIIAFPFKSNQKYTDMIYKNKKIDLE